MVEHPCDCLIGLYLAPYSLQVLDKLGLKWHFKNILKCQNVAAKWPVNIAVVTEVLVTELCSKNKDFGIAYIIRHLFFCRNQWLPPFYIFNFWKKIFFLCFYNSQGIPKWSLQNNKKKKCTKTARLPWSAWIMSYLSKEIWWRFRKILSAVTLSIIVFKTASYVPPLI